MAYGQGLYQSWFYGVDGSYKDASISVSVTATTSCVGQITVNSAPTVSARGYGCSRLYS
jgi:hypothetical protein